MLPSPHLAKVLAEITRFDEAHVNLATARGLTTAEKRRRAGHLARLRGRLPSFVHRTADTATPPPARIEPSPLPRRSS
jgi:hypothetical protein